MRCQLKCWWHATKLKINLTSTATEADQLQSRTTYKVQVGVHTVYVLSSKTR